jgi:hypothetical protein
MGAGGQSIRSQRELHESVMGRYLILLATLVALAAPAAARAQGIETLANHRDWAAYKFMEDGKPVCYVASTPKQNEGKYTKRGDIFARVSHWPGHNEFDQVSFVAGYKYKEGSPVEVNIDGTKFNLEPVDDVAWARDEDDAALVKAMIKGRGMVVRGESWRGTKTKDTYSLLGFAKAYETIGEACGVK